MKTKKQISKALKRALNSREGFDIIFSARECGWLDGGCWDLAKGIQRWMGHEALVVCVHDFQGAPQHFAVRLWLDDIYIDGDGLSSSKELLDRMVKEEFVDGPPTIENVPGNLQSPVNEIECDDQVSDAVSAFLSKRFGSGEEMARKIRAAFASEMEPCQGTMSL